MPRRRDQIERRGEHGQRLQAEEVEFHQARRLDPFHVELGRRHVGFGIAIERHQLVERPVADDDAGGMGRGVSSKVLRAFCAISSSRATRSIALRASPAAAARRPSPASASSAWPGFAAPAWPACPPGRSGISSTRPTSRSTPRARNEPKVMICATRSRAIALAHIGDDLVAPRLAEVDVEIRHRNALGIKKSLEEQAEAQGIEIGDGQRIGDQRAGARAAARPDRNPLGLRPFDEVGDDQKIAGEAHLHDDVELEVEPRG